MMDVRWIAVAVALAGGSAIASDPAGAVFGRGDCVLAGAGLGGQVVEVGHVGHLIEVPVKKGFGEWVAKVAQRAFHEAVTSGLSIRAV